MLRFPAVSIILLGAAIAPAVETTEVSLRHGATNDNLVTITRDEDGNLLFEDAYTDPTSLQDLAANPTDHGALAGLEDDDHPHYLTTARHDAEHDAVYNGALPIAGDVNDNDTLGGHIGDDEVHPNISETVALTGVWQFLNGLGAYGGNIALGSSQYSAAPAIRFGDDPEDAEISYDATGDEFTVTKPLTLETLRVTTTLDGRDATETPSGEITGFASIEGIAPADLLSSTRSESIAEPWTFLDTLTVATTIADGIPQTRLVVVNTGASAIAIGDVVQWNGISSTHLAVRKSTTTVGTTTPFAGVAITSAAATESLTIVTEGVVAVKLADSIEVGDPLVWTFAGAHPFDGSTTDASIGSALEDAEPPDTGRVYIRWTSHYLP